jgi:hypothetical protein
LQFYEEGFPTAKRLLGVHQASKAAAALALSGDIDIRVTPLLLAAYTVTASDREAVAGGVAAD